MNGQENAAFWKLSLVFAQNHYSFPCGNSKNCMFSTCTLNIKRKDLKEKCGEKFLHVKQKLWSFLFLSIIKWKTTQRLLRLNLTILFNNQSLKRPSHSVLPLTSTYMTVGLNKWINKTLKERVWCLLNLFGCSYTEAEVGPLPPTNSAASYWQLKGNKPEGFLPRCKVPGNPISICNPPCANLCPSEAPPFPISDFNQPCMAMASRHGRWCGTLLDNISPFSLVFKANVYHISQKRWRLQVSPSQLQVLLISRLCHHWRNRKCRHRT